MREAGFAKLFSTIVTSTIWQENKETKILWITMLALANRYGEVGAAEPGLAHAAGLTLDETLKSLKKLESPDSYSRNQDHKGRRITKIEGGWQILNYALYRKKMRSRAEYFREYRRRNRNKSATRTTPPQPIAEAEAEAEEKYSPNSEEFRLSFLLLTEIRKRKSNFRQPNLQKWAVHIDRLIRLDHRTPEQIEKVIRWCQQDDFWQNNILSTEKLRKQIDKLELAIGKGVRAVVPLQRGLNGRTPGEVFREQLGRAKDAK